ncbi:MAG: twin-arginine translocase TatA/TatE family subunit [Desulfobulbus sp.]|nr:twin-arginine translocase TatA/TatE family subunit [Desulfobulbus sp.]
MFGIGLPEMIVIFAVALIVVGPDKLPGLARSLAKGVMEMKKTLNQLKDSLNEDGGELDSVQKELRATADDLKERMIDTDPSHWHPAAGPGQQPTEEEIIDVEIEAEEAAANATETAAAEVAEEEPSPQASRRKLPSGEKPSENVPPENEATTP